MLGGGTRCSVFVRQKSVGNVFVEEVRVERDHLIQLRISNMIGNTFVIVGTFKSSLICQDVDDLVPRKSKAKEEAADNGENVKLLSEFSDTRARYILKWWLSYFVFMVSPPERHVVVDFHKVLRSLIQPTAGDPETKIARRSLWKTLSVRRQ